MADDIRDALDEIGAPANRVDAAVDDGSIVGLTFETLVNGVDDGQYTVEDVAGMSGVDPLVGCADPVNKAARLTSYAYPGSVLASNSVKEEAEDAECVWRSLGRIKLKDLGPTRIWLAERRSDLPRPLTSSMSLSSLSLWTRVFLRCTQPRPPQIASR